jgi:hypothetical protein
MLTLQGPGSVAQLAQRLPGRHTYVEPTRVTRVVQEEYARFDGRPIRDFIPLFAEPNASQELAKPGA